MILIFLVFTSCFLAYWHYARTYSFWDKKGVDNIKPYTFAGSFSSNVVLQKSVPEIVQEHYNKYKNNRFVNVCKIVVKHLWNKLLCCRYFGMYQFTLPTFVVKDMELLKLISVKDFDTFIDHANSANEELDPLWSKNILALVGEYNSLIYL